MANKRSRQTTQKSANLYPYSNLAADIIIDAIQIVNDDTSSNCQEKRQALEFLKSKKCQRWAGTIGVDFQACISREDSKVKILEA